VKATEHQNLDAGERIYRLFCQQLMAGWLIQRDPQQILDLAEGKLAEFTHSQPNFIAIATADPIEFIATLMAGLRRGIPLFLGNPHWRSTEWALVSKLTNLVDLDRHRHLIMIPTGGSSGEIKFAMHTWETLSASAWGFQEFYEVDCINSVCTLPLYHVSGLMQLWRSLLTNGKLVILDFHQLSDRTQTLPQSISIDNYFISLVPTQLAKLLDLDLATWLAEFKTILIGGASPKIELLDRARQAKLPLALTYGMTETASQIASLKPAEFLAGSNNCGRVLPHADIKLSALDSDRVGSIQIAAKSLMLGYFPDLDLPNYYEPDDIGTIDNRGYLTICGRNSDKIITGGENVFPIEVINAIMSTGLVADVWVLGLPDDYWGQVVAAIYVEDLIPVSGEMLAMAIADKISKYKIPKQWFPVAEIPRNILGKVLIQEATNLAAIASNSK
jgi:o-succinylbenzoate---CoA ligase